MEYYCDLVATASVVCKRDVYTFVAEDKVTGINNAVDKRKDQEYWGFECNNSNNNYNNNVP